MYRLSAAALLAFVAAIAHAGITDQFAGTYQAVTARAPDAASYGPSMALPQRILSPGLYGLVFSSNATVRMTAAGRGGTLFFATTAEISVKVAQLLRPVRDRLLPGAEVNFL